MSGAPTANAAFKHAKTGVQGINRPAGLVRHLPLYIFARSICICKGLWHDYAVHDREWSKGVNQRYPELQETRLFPTCSLQNNPHLTTQSAGLHLWPYEYAILKRMQI